MARSTRWNGKRWNGESIGDRMTAEEPLNSLKGRSKMTVPIKTI